MTESLILFNTVQKILGKVISLASQELWVAWGLQRDLKRLETSLSSINAVILDAQEQRTTNHKLSLWLRQLRHVLYDAEDVIDEFAYQVLRTRVVNTRGGTNRKVRRFFSTTSNPMLYRVRIGRRVKGIRRRLDEINANKNEFNLATNFQAEDGHIGRFKEREMTHSFVDTYDIVGREADSWAIVQFLMDPRGQEENVSIIPIVGIGGLGKTALAKLVFNHKRVVDHFQSKVWVCLGDIKEFNVNQVMSNIVKSLTTFTKESTFDTSNPQHLQKAIQDRMQNKRFLLILDDMWDVDRSRWLELKALLACGAEGSKIVVTTRNSSVASCVGTISPYNLKGISHLESVALFQKLAFVGESEVDQSLMKIGEEIVRKCKGIPLAVRTLGSLLFSKTDKHEWSMVRDGAIWKIEDGQNEILHILKFSYNQLSSQLKQCFVYCSIFPEDYLFYDLSLISFWMAHGLLQIPKRKQGNVPTSQLEYIGKRYIKELLLRGFFQELKDFSWFSTFKMHDLIRELACSLGGEEFVVINTEEKNIGENVRHVWFQGQNVSTNSSDLIQTVLSGNFGGQEKFSEACITKFKHLKVLSLADSKFKELPKSIGTLKHLRSLDLQGCVGLKRLPNSIYKLHNLQSLLLSRCNIEEVPEQIGEFVNLRILGITTKQKQLPYKNGIESLTSLQYVECMHSPNLEILFGGTQVRLESLRTLIVQDCARLISLFTSCYLPALEVLCICYCQKLNLNLTDREHEDGWLQLPSLRWLTLDCLPQLEDGLPQWIEGCAETLECLEIKYCENLKALPEWLPKLTALRTLKIKHCYKLVSLPQGMQQLTALKELQISHCSRLGARCSERIGEDWHMIAHVPNITITDLRRGKD